MLDSSYNHLLSWMKTPFSIFKDFQSSIATVKKNKKYKTNWKTTFAKHIWDKGLYL